MKRKTHSSNTKRILFNKLQIINGYDPKIWRIDNANKIVCFPSYGDMKSRYGWNIHHINQVRNDNRLSNLLAVHFDSHYEIHN